MDNLLTYNMQQVIRELSLFSCSDEELDNRFFNSISTGMQAAHKSGTLDKKEAFRQFYNTIPNIMLRYYVVFGGIGCRLTALGKLALARNLTENYSIDLD